MEKDNEFHVGMKWTSHFYCWIKELKQSLISDVYIYTLYIVPKSSQPRDWNQVLLKRSLREWEDTILSQTAKPKAIY